MIHVKHLLQALQKKEVIKDIPGYEGRYAINRYGYVWSHPKPRSKKGRWLKNNICGNGYQGVSLMGDGAKSTKKIHKLVSDAFIPNPKNRPCINHKDGNKANNSVENLEWCTYSENNKHAWDLGLMTPPNGIYTSRNRKFSLEQIAEIKSDLKKLNQVQVAQKWDVHQKTIWAIHRGETYKEVEGI